MTEPEKPRAKARQAPYDEEVYGTLGALLGTLEVIATDDHHPLPATQVERLRGALRLGNAMQAHVEALLMLSDDALAQRLTRAKMAMRPLIEHAVRGALRSFDKGGVALVLPTTPEWGSERVLIDSSRVDRTIRALAEQLAARVGDGGVLEVSLELRGASVLLTLRGHEGSGGEKKVGNLVIAGARRLFEIHGGSLEVDEKSLSLVIALPAAEAP